MSDATFYKWRSKYGGMDLSDARRLKALEDENRQLKKLLAESMLDAATLKEMLEKKLLTPRSRTNGRDLGDQGQELLAAACVRVGWPGSRNLPLCSRSDRTMHRSASGCRNWPRSDGGSAIDACTFCCGARASC